MYLPPPPVRNGRPSRRHWSTVNVPGIYSNIERRKFNTDFSDFPEVCSKRVEQVEK